MRYLALGDSYTIGEGVAEAERWPVQLVTRLRREGIAIDEAQIVATTGWTTDELSAAMDATVFTPPYDLVSLLIGVNNQYRGRSTDEYRGEFQRLLDRAIELAGERSERVFVLSIPDWGATAFGQQSGRDVAQIADELDAYNAAARDLCATRKVAWVDITPSSRAFPDQVADDGLHPSGEQYSLWAAEAWPAIQAALYV
ncbi:SGNH/GDSL hydrolase family protein [Dyella sp. GSA-30]|uniref:SGNH/GDSL hydrolase family protein n=1 Tax=Dyella sp. GSA-30 TaxID=2994496 RepID=UPI0024921106|nr:SGNH/GDSL hydrolase family protein [Dyella sp. GSA-30]BDU18756.1 lysophospholipase [Dyella sp. GSA-30]